MTCEEFVQYIERKIHPYTLSEKGRASAATLFRKYPEELLLECIDIGVERYFRYDTEGHLTQESARLFFDKLGGIAYNKSQSPIAQEITHIKNKCKNLYSYWDEARGTDTLYCYVNALSKAGWNDDQILDDLRTEVNRLATRSHNWTQWMEGMQNWIDDINSWGDVDAETVNQLGTIIPDAVMSGTPTYIQKLIKQINASYENNLFDCCAVMMRRLLEVLLVLTYQHLNVESDIMDKSGIRHVTLDKIIQNAEQHPVLALSANTRRDMRLFKDLGNFSAHKIWYNCTQQDIKPHVLNYRVIIEELIYKADLK